MLYYYGEPTVLVVPTWSGFLLSLVDIRTVARVGTQPATSTDGSQTVDPPIAVSRPLDGL